MITIKREESVLVAIALFLLAGVIIYNVLSSPNEEKDGGSILDETFTTVVTTTRVVTTKTESQSETDSVKININTADIKQLTTLTGIGEVKAQAIIDYRETYGPFPTKESLTNVTGIGEKTLTKIVDKITI